MLDENHKKNKIMEMIKNKAKKKNRILTLANGKRYIGGAF